MSDKWRIELLGGIRATCGGRVISRFRSGKSGSLLGYLARYPGRLHSRERLAEMFWPGAEAGRGRASLSTAVWSLRQLLEASPSGSAELLVTSRESVSLAAAAVDSDVEEFMALLTDLRARSAEMRVDLLERAVGLYAGEFMAGHYDDWVFPEQAYFASQLRLALSELISAFEQVGQVERAIGYAARAVELEPLREENHRRLMELHIRGGDLEQARRQYARLRRILDRELGTEPSAVTRELVAGLRGVSPSSATPRGAGPVAGLRSGTFTVLFAGRGDCRGHGGMPEQLRTTLSAHVRRYGGIDAGRTTTLAALFPGVEEALACAGAIRRSAASEAVRNRLSLALDTGRVEVEADACRGPALRGASRLLRSTSSGWMLCSERAAAVASPELDPRISLRDLGMYRLKPSATPERVFSVHWQGTDEVGGLPLTLAPERQGSTPAPATPVFGRDRERARLCELVLQGDARLVTVLGPAGIGKTTLAVQVAGDLMESGPGTVWYVPLGSISDTREIPEAILRVLEPGATSGSDVFGRVAAALGNGVSFLVLDCLEHLLPEAGRTLQQLLDRRPMLRCIVTSRRALGLPSEQQMALGPLPSPAQAERAEEQRQCPSVRLFIDRARTALPDFEVTPANQDAVVSLCTRLEGFPLAIVLAAGRAGVMTPEQLLKRIAQRFDLLVRPGPDDADRHRSLDSALTANVALLSEDTRVFLARLSVFRGGFTLEAAEAVCEAPDAADHLAELRDCSLVTSKIHGPHLRFLMLDTIREFARSLMRPEQVGACQLRHVEYFRQFAGCAGGQISRRQAVDALERLDLDQANLAAAIEHGLTAAPDMALALAVHLNHYWEVRGLWSYSRHILTTALAHAPHAETILRAQALHALGWVTYLLGDGDEAQPHLERALELARDIGDGLLETRIAYCVAFIAQAQGRLDDAWELNERHLRLAIHNDTAGHRGLAFAGFAGIKIERGEFDAAEKLHEQALGEFRQLGDDRAIAATLREMGRAEKMQGNLAEATRLYEQALAIFRQVADPISVAWALRALAGIERRCGRLSQAQDLAEQAIENLRPVGNREELVQLLLEAGRIAVLADDHDRARTHLGEAMALADDLGDREGADMAREELTKLCPASPRA